MKNYIHTFEDQLSDTFLHAGHILTLKRRDMLFWYRMKKHQKRAAQKRLEMKEKGYQIPPVMICSLTTECNLDCKGCYSRVLHQKQPDAFTPANFRIMLKEAQYLGISTIFLAGGEPFMRKDLLEVTAGFPSIMFPVFTNGLLIDDDMLQRIKKQKNIIPLVSVEGNAMHTSERRGITTWKQVKLLMDSLAAAKVCWGISITLTRDNFYDCISHNYLDQISRSGARLTFLIEYVPIARSTANLTLTTNQKQMLNRYVQDIRSKRNHMIFAFPGDEEQFGGCLAAGRGFIHVNAAGMLEACPFAPWSDCSVLDNGLLEGLLSPVMQTIRQNHHLLEEGKGGCALWHNKEKVSELLNVTA